MSDHGPDLPAADARVEELLRINAELAAEIRDLRARRIEQPRSAAMPAARRLAALIGERDASGAEAEALSAELEQTRAHNEELGRQIHALFLEHRELAERLQAESRPPGGLRRLGRRLRAKLRHPD